MRKINLFFIIVLTALGIQPSWAADVNSNCITTAESINANRIVVGQVNTMGLANAGSPICPGSDPCTIVTNYQVKYDLSTGLGTASGEMKLLTKLIPTTPSEVIVDSFPINGKLDLSPALTKGLPFGSFDGNILLADGQYKIHVDVLIPFPCGAPLSFCYLRNAQVIPAVQSDFASGLPGVPTLRFESSFSK